MQRKPAPLGQHRQRTMRQQMCLPLSCRPVHVQGVDAAAAADSEYGPLLLLDTAGCDMEEASDEVSDSKRNQGEAQVALAHAQRLVALGVAPHDIGIITPYSAQVCLYVLLDS